MKNMKALAINLHEAQDLMCAIVVRRLRELKWSPSDIESAADKAIARLGRLIENEESLAELAKDAAMMHASGASEKRIQQMANAMFAPAAVRVADDLHKSRIAEFN